MGFHPISFRPEQATVSRRAAHITLPCSIVVRATRFPSSAVARCIHSTRAVLDNLNSPPRWFHPASAG